MVNKTLGVVSLSGLEDVLFFYLATTAANYVSIMLESVSLDRIIYLFNPCLKSGRGVHQAIQGGTAHPWPPSGYGILHNGSFT